MNKSVPAEYLAVNNPDFIPAFKHASQLTSQQLHSLASEAGFDTEFGVSTSMTRAEFRYLGRMAEEALLLNRPPKMIQEAREQAGYDGPVRTLYQGWTLDVARQVSEDFPLDLGTRLVLGVRPLRSHSVIRVPLVMSMHEASYGSRSVLPNDFMIIGANLESAGINAVGERALRIAEISHSFLKLLANQASPEAQTPSFTQRIFDRYLIKHGLSIPDTRMRPIASVSFP